MSYRPIRSSAPLATAAAAMLVSAWACNLPAPKAAPVPGAVVESPAPISVSITHVVDSIVTTASTTSNATGGVPTSEPLISINFPTPVDVRIPLRMIAADGHYGLVVPPEVNKKIAITIDSVPVSVALREVLQAAGLGLVPTQTQRPRLPYDTTVVFYQLPVNVDSLSADAIVKRFGVGRDIAELIVLSRIWP